MPYIVNSKLGFFVNPNKYSINHPSHRKVMYFHYKRVTQGLVTDPLCIWYYRKWSHITLLSSLSLPIQIDQERFLTKLTFCLSPTQVNLIRIIGNMHTYKYIHVQFYVLHMCIYIRKGGRESSLLCSQTIREFGLLTGKRKKRQIQNSCANLLPSNPVTHSGSNL